MASVKAEILGATNYQLNAKFVNDHKCLGSWCFGPSVTNSSEGKGPEYSAVSLYKGLAVGYDQRMPNRTSVAAGLARLRLNLPADTSFSSVVKQYSKSGDWGETTGTSKALGKLLSGFDPQGKFCVFFQAFHSNGNTTYSTKDVQEASVSAWIVGVNQGCG
jgi:hypothetical protein